MSHRKRLTIVGSPLNLVPRKVEILGYRKRVTIGSSGEVVSGQFKKLERFAVARRPGLAGSNRGALHLADIYHLLGV